jgi:threonine synthase
MSRCLAYFNKDKTVKHSSCGYFWRYWRCCQRISGLRSRSNHSLSIRKVSNIQEKQLTTLGQNIKALEVDGVLMIVRTW